MAAQNGHSDTPGAVDIETEHAESEVIDEEKYSHKRRLTAIHNAHDRAINVRDAVEERLIQGAVSEHHARRYYRGAVESLIMQLLPVIESDEFALDRDYADEVKIGEVTVAPPEDLVQFARANIGRLPPGVGVPQPTTHELHGLRSILEAPSPFREQFAVTTMDGDGSPVPVSQTVETEIPRRVLDTAIQTVTQALEDAEMGLNTDTNEVEAEIKYQHLYPRGGPE